MHSYLFLLPVIMMASLCYSHSHHDYDDFGHLIDLHNPAMYFGYNHSCSNSPYAVMIMTHVDNFEQRNLLRETWTKDVPYVFVMTAQGWNETQATWFSNEMFTYGDMFAADVGFKYTNTYTYKTVLGLKWFNYFCSEVKYVIKTHDWVFVNTPYLTEFLFNRKDDFKFMCNHITEAKDRRVERNPGGYLPVSKMDYYEDEYPIHCNWLFTIYSSDLAREIYEVAQKNKYFAAEDIWLTGILPSMSSNYISYENIYDKIYQSKQLKDLAYKKFSLKDEPFMYGEFEPLHSKGAFQKLWENGYAISKNEIKK